ncbi:MAG TPA: hypothetical protein VM840_12095 [Actinomycetota bacterium]|nr:hypothetical protein [Actinomycetota bacterium]
MNVLFVCTGNVCRSPMAEGFLRKEALERGLDIDVRSTGTHAWPMRAATWDGREVMSELGVPIDEHRTRLYERPLIEWADLIVGLAVEHVRDVVRDHPDAAPRTFGLKELLALLRQVPPQPTPKDLVRAADAAREEAPPLDDADVLDPFGERREAYRRVAGEIRTLIEELAAAFERRPEVTNA